jgi:hypothetical protein
MSESMAFIGGVAVAGLAAIVLLKGTGTPLQPNFAVGQQQMPLVQQPVMLPQQQYPQQYGQVAPNVLPQDPNGELRINAERQRMQMEVLQRENEQLKNQNQQFQQFQLQQQQLQLNPANSNSRTAQPPQLASAETPWWSSPIVWAVGGMTLTIGGGVVVAGVLALFSSKERPSRTVQVIHPYHGPTPPLGPVRRAEFLPPRTETRRVQAPEYEDMQ